jgi:hypothetical protein
MLADRKRLHWLGHGIRTEQTRVNKKISGSRPEVITKVRRPTLHWLVDADIDL